MGVCLTEAGFPPLQAAFFVYGPWFVRTATNG